MGSEFRAKMGARILLYKPLCGGGLCHLVECTKKRQTSESSPDASLHHVDMEHQNCSDAPIMPQETSNVRPKSRPRSPGSHGVSELEQISLQRARETLCRAGNITLLLHGDDDEHGHLTLLEKTTGLAVVTVRRESEKRRRATSSWRPV